jgi:uncharacterized protein (DUF305 family)
MKTFHIHASMRLLIGPAAMALLIAASGSAFAQTAATPPVSASEAAAMAKARADSAQYPYTNADVDFMTGMIAHHAQAIVMSRMAPSHGASASVRTLAERIINSQQDEIATTQMWRRDRNKPVPDPNTSGMQMPMNGSMGNAQPMLMPGMLTEAQMKQLDAARGKNFDRLFLSFMIRHHQGAVKMVSDLFDTNGAAQDQTIFKFASDVNADQTTEIARMQRMLDALNSGSQAP